MPIDPYSLALAANVYHRVRGAVIALNFIKNRKQRNVLEVLQTTKTTIADLPLEIVDVIAAELLAAECHKDRCDCWLRYYDSWEGDCACVDEIEHTCRPNADGQCHCFDAVREGHCMYDCLSLDALLVYGDFYEDARTWQTHLETNDKSAVKRTHSIERQAAVSCSHG